MGQRTGSFIGAVGVVGGSRPLRVGSVAVAGTAVAAGFILLAFAFVGAWQQRRRLAD